MAKPVRPPAKCGTDGGYYRHLRTAKTEPCGPCRKAHSDYEKARIAAKNGKPDAKCERCGATTSVRFCRTCRVIVNRAEKAMAALDAAQRQVPTKPEQRKLYWVREGLIWRARPLPVVMDRWAS